MKMLRVRSVTFTQMAKDKLLDEKKEALVGHMDGMSPLHTPQLCLSPADQPLEKRPISVVGVSDLARDRCVVFMMEEEGGKVDASCNVQYVEQWIDE